MAATPISGIEAIGAAIKGIGIPETVLNATPAAQPAQVGRIDFKELLNTAISSISDTQASADNAIANLAAGNNIELHSVMLAAEKANLTLQLAMQIKNKITDAYSEIMRMQI